MKNELLKNFKDKIECTLDNLKTIEDDIIKLSEEISKMIQNESGRIIFVGAGISADMAKIIIEEMWFNFQIPRDKFISVTAAKTFSDSVIKWKELEEIPQTVVFELESLEITTDDLLIGLTSSGKTQYVISALTYARNSGCKTAVITDSANELFESDYIDFKINTSFGSPVVLGLNSAGGSTVQKIIIDNVLYLAMEMAGRIYQQSLVYMEPVSKKIEEYCINVICKLVNVEEEEAKDIFDKSDRRLEIALISSLKKVSPEDARELLFINKGNFNKILN